MTNPFKGFVGFSQPFLGFGDDVDDDGKEEDDDERGRLVTQRLENDGDCLRICFSLTPMASHRTFHKERKPKSSFSFKKLSLKEALQGSYGKRLDPNLILAVKTI